MMSGAQIQSMSDKAARKAETHGYALIESGQFQGYVGVFERTTKSC